MSFKAPIGDLLLSMRTVGGFDALLGEEDARAILTEAGALAENVLLPLDRVGDRTGLALLDGGVATPPGWREAYAVWREGGWAGLAASADHGGTGLPALLNVAVMEIWSSANAAFALGPVLSAGAVEALARHGSPALRQLYLPHLIAGRWTGTMNLTEPQAGSDVGALRTRATPQPDGTYKVAGQKIYITYGEHDLTENIVHLVLARLPDAPPGHRGISLFLVPKYLPDAEGRPGTRNDLFCSGLEGKLGMHASPTCTMVFGDGGGATGWLVGEANRGLACMFTMMNNARLAVAIQGVAAAERATQQAIAFAKSRLQGRSTVSPDGPGPIIHHPDVARMLVRMQAETAAARAICHLTAAAIDRGDEGRAGLLTPLAKAYATEVGSEVASLGMQVHGGIGYIEDSGAAQIWRDVRIAAIYEGTNGIQAIDLVTRKLPLAGGAVLAGEIAAMRDTIGQLGSRNASWFGASARRLGEAVDALEMTAAFLADANPGEALAGASATLRLFGLARGGTALAALAVEAADERMAVITRFFAEQLCPEAGALALAVQEGGGAITGADAVWREPA